MKCVAKSHGTDGQYSSGRSARGSDDMMPNSSSKKSESLSEIRGKMRSDPEAEIVSSGLGENMGRGWTVRRVLVVAMVGIACVVGDASRESVG